MAPRPGPKAPLGSPARPGTIVQRGRAKAYRPLPAGRRREILDEGLSAYARRDYFLAHELLEPAWMGAADPAERDLYQGLIKLAAAYVHHARGNPVGVLKNLRGARERLADARPAADAAGVDVDGLVAEVDRLLARLEDARAPTRPIGQIRVRRRPPA
jgi:predicted metal-dependent hydrolase